MISPIHVTSLRIDYGLRLLFECLIRSLYIIFFSFLDSLVFCLAEQIMLVLASLGSWLPFAIVALVSLMRRTPFCYSISLLVDSLVCGDLFRCIYLTLPTETQTRLSRHGCLFDFTDHCSSDRQFIADWCDARFIHEESQWHVQGRRELNCSDRETNAFSSRTGRRIKRIAITFNAMWNSATMVECCSRSVSIYWGAFLSFVWADYQHGIPGQPIFVLLLRRERGRWQSVQSKKETRFVHNWAFLGPSVSVLRSNGRLDSWFSWSYWLFSGTNGFSNLHLSDWLLFNSEYSSRN